MFSTQNKLPEMTNGVIYYFKAILVVIQKTLKNFQTLFPLLRKTGLKFLIFRLISRERAGLH